METGRLLSKPPHETVARRPNGLVRFGNLERNKPPGNSTVIQVTMSVMIVRHHKATARSPAELGAKLISVSQPGITASAPTDIPRRTSVFRQPAPAEKGYFLKADYVVSTLLNCPLDLRVLVGTLWKHGKREGSTGRARASHDRHVMVEHDTENARLCGYPIIFSAVTPSLLTWLFPKPER